MKIKLLFREIRMQVVEIDSTMAHSVEFHVIVFLGFAGFIQRGEEFDEHGHQGSKDNSCEENKG
jgi:hypothetical protein